MSTWNEMLFRTYTHGNGKAGIGSAKGNKTLLSYDEASANGKDFGGILCPDLVDVSFDDPDMSKKFIEMAECSNWKTVILLNPKTNHVHSFWKDSFHQIKSLSSKNIKLSVGFIADIHGGDTYIPLRANGVDRFPPIYDSGELQEIPEELIPCGAKADLWNLGKGGRNDALSSVARYLVKDGRFDKEQVKRIITNANKFVLAEALPDSEIQTILRDETFRDIHQTPELDFITAAELFNADIKPVEFIVDGLIPIGLTILASPPKYGKSWMCLDLALSVATGRKFLKYPTNKCDVLYLALEDRNDRLKARIAKTFKGTWPNELMLSTQAEKLEENGGLLFQLEQLINKNPALKFVIVDTFIKVRGEPKRNESAYSADSREAGIIKKFADEHGIGIMLVTHTRKGIDPTDPFVNITGTYGVAGAADDMIVLTKPNGRGDDTTKMSITGRDVTHEELALTFDGEHGKWLLQSESYDDYMRETEMVEKQAEYHSSNIRKTILHLIDENGGTWSGTCKDVIKKSTEYSTPIALTSQKLGAELKNMEGYLFEDGVTHTEISNGSGAKKHKFSKS